MGFIWLPCGHATFAHDLGLVLALVFVPAALGPILGDHGIECFAKRRLPRWKDNRPEVKLREHLDVLPRVSRVPASLILAVPVIVGVEPCLLGIHGRSPF